MDRRQFLRASVGSIALSSLLAVRKAAWGDEQKLAALMQTLPPDSTWVAFNVNVMLDGQDLDGQDIVLTWMSRSVGQAFQGGKQCRFIELELTSEHPEIPNTTWRLLVPEEEFGEGRDPLSKTVKRWVKERTNRKRWNPLNSKILSSCCGWQGRSKTSRLKKPRRRSLGSKVIWNAR